MMCIKRGLGVKFMCCDVCGRERYSAHFDLKIM